MRRFNFSKGQERLGMAMTSGSTEVPFIAQMHEFAMRESGIPGDVFYTDARKFVRAISETSEKFGFDTPSFIWDVYNIEAQALGCKLVTFKDMAPALDNAEPLIETESDLARLKAPDPYSSGRMGMVFEVLQEVKSQAGMVPLPSYCAPFTLASQVMTFENLIVQIRKNPKFVHQVLSFLVDEVIAPYMNALLKEFPEAPLADGSDAVASLPFISQDMLEEFALGYIERLRQQTIRQVICDNWWGDSFSDDLHGFWGLKLRATPDYLKVQDPDLFKVGVQPVVEYAKENNLPAVLGVDNNVLQTGPREEIERRVHEYMEAIEEIGKGTLYLCSLSAVTPAENVRTAIAAAHRFRSGDRPYAGVRRAERPIARGGSEGKKTKTQVKAAQPVDVDSTPEEEILDRIFDAVLDGDEAVAPANVKQALDMNLDVHLILDEGLIAAMDDIGDQFSEGGIFVPEMLMAARAMKRGLEVLRPLLTNVGAKPKGKVMLATVQGDVHDIGKNLVGMMLEGAGYEVIDLGVNKTPEEILQSAEGFEPDLIGLSALLTTSMPSMQKTVMQIKEKGSKFPVIVGGAPVTQAFADAIKAEGYGENAPQAVQAVHALVNAKGKDIPVQR